MPETAAGLENGDIISFEIKMVESAYPGKAFCLFTKTPDTLRWERIELKDSFAELSIGRSTTNNLEIKSISILEDALNQYRGAILLVSHDEMFVKNIKIDIEVKL